MDRDTHARHITGPTHSGPPAAPALPRLNLPRFELAARPARMHAMPAVHQPHVAAAHAAAIPAQHVSHARHPQYAQPAPQPVVHVHGTSAPAYHAAPVQYAAAPAAASYSMPMRPALVPASISAISDRTFRDRFAPIHLAALAAMLVIALIMSQAPGRTFRASPAKLPIPVGMAPAASQSTLPLKRAPQGMPSPAAAASIAAERGEPIPTEQTSAVRFKGIPSPAAARTMAPATLPLQRQHAMSLPYDTGERDTHATDDHYGRNEVTGGGGEDVLPQRPVMTPAEAADQARLQATQQQLADAGAAPSMPNETF